MKFSEISILVEMGCLSLGGEREIRVDFSRKSGVGEIYVMLEVYHDSVRSEISFAGYDMKPSVSAIYAIRSSHERISVFHKGESVQSWLSVEEKEIGEYLTSVFNILKRDDALVRKRMVPLLY